MHLTRSGFDLPSDFDLPSNTVQVGSHVLYHVPYIHEQEPIMLSKRWIDLCSDIIIQSILTLYKGRKVLDTKRWSGMAQVSTVHRED